MLPDEVRKAVDCQHTVTSGRWGEKGYWCIDCGEKVYEVDDRKCGDCAGCVPVFGGHVCKPHRMAVSPGMNVTYKISKGSCWHARITAHLSENRRG